MHYRLYKIVRTKVVIPITPSNHNLGDKVIMKKGLFKSQKTTVQKNRKKDLRLVADSLSVIVYAKGKSS